MPGGTYRLLDPHDGRLLGFEHFSCARGPAGWRYAGQVLAADADTRVGSVDVTVDARWRQVRVELVAAGWRVRGGSTGATLRWVRAAYDGSAAAEDAAPAAALTGRSPAFLVTTARLLELRAGERRRLRLVRFSEPALAPLLVDEGWALTGVEHHETETGPLTVERYEVADLATGERSVVHLAGDVVLAAPGIELDDLDAPPNL